MSRPFRVFTCSVYPDLTRVWYRALSRTFQGSPPPALIFDCAGRLRSEWFPDAEICRVPNWEHGRKIDLALESLTGADPVLIMDDDAFVLSVPAIERALQWLDDDPGAAVYTFHVRDWWKLPAAGGLHVPMGSYALLVKPDIIRNEGLSFRTVPSSDPSIREATGYWDTADYCQKELLDRGYRIEYGPEEDRLTIPTFFGASGGFLTYARRAILANRYVRRWRQPRTIRAVLGDTYAYQRACSLTSVIDLFRRMIGERPSFDDWFDVAELVALAQALPDPALRQQYAATAERIFGVRDSVANGTAQEALVS